MKTHCDYYRPSRSLRRVSDGFPVLWSQRVAEEGSKGMCVDSGSCVERMWVALPPPGGVLPKAFAPLTSLGQAVDSDVQLLRQHRPPLWLYYFMFRYGELLAWMILWRKCTPCSKLIHFRENLTDWLQFLEDKKIALQFHGWQITRCVWKVEEKAVAVSLKEPRGRMCKMLGALLLVTVQMLRVNQSPLHLSTGKGKFTRHSVILTPCFIARTETNVDVVDAYFVSPEKRRGNVLRFHSHNHTLDRWKCHYSLKQELNNSLQDFAILSPTRANKVCIWKQNK